MKRYQVLVYSFVRNQLERRSRSILAKYFFLTHRNDTSFTFHIYQFIYHLDPDISGK